VILGEGGSGGALAIGIGDRIVMLENAVYSVISPEGCAAILWKDAAKSDRAAESLRLTAEDLFNSDWLTKLSENLRSGKSCAGEDLKNRDLFDEIADSLKKTLLDALADLSRLTANADGF
jgi:acetyl-CoA carboxylase carboxyl transferase subunit alpha